MQINQCFEPLDLNYNNYCSIVRRLIIEHYYKKKTKEWTLLLLLVALKLKKFLTIDLHNSVDTLLIRG